MSSPTRSRGGTQSNGRIAAAAAIALAAAGAVPATAGAADVTASATAQAKAQVSTAQAARLAASSTGRAVRALDRARTQMRQAERLAVSAVAEAPGPVAAEMAAEFSVGVDEHVGRLVKIAARRTGKVRLVAARLIREDVVLDARVTAALAARADKGNGAAEAEALATGDAERVQTIGRLQLLLDGGRLSRQSREAAEQAQAAALAVRTAVIARVTQMRAEAEAGVAQAVTSAAEAIDQRTEALGPITVSAEADAGLAGASGSASLTARFSGVVSLRRAVSRIAALRG